MSSPRGNAGGSGAQGAGGDSNFLGKFGFTGKGGRQSGGLVKDGKAHAPQYDSKEDEELGIDRALMDPIKFVSAIDSKPVYPPYLQLADFETYLTQEANRQTLASAKEQKGEHGSADKAEKEIDQS